MGLGSSVKPPRMWDSQQYWLKAKAYFDRMQAESGGAADAALFAAMSLEYFGRAALCSVHPALNADPQEEGAHIIFAFGVGSPKLPKTIPIHSVYSRLVKIFPAVFTKEHQDAADYLAKLRNEEMHTALLPFEGLSEAKWLSGYYDVVFAVIKILGKKGLDLFESAKKASAARALVKVRRDKRVGEVKQLIAQCMKAFQALAANEREARQRVSEQASRIHPSSAVADCPACKAKVVLRGTLLQIEEPELVDGELVSEVRYATDRVSCSACKLRLRGATAISVAELPPRFQLSQKYDLHESRDAEEEEEYDNM